MNANQIPWTRSDSRDSRKRLGSQGHAYPQSHERETCDHCGQEDCCYTCESAMQSDSGEQVAGRLKFNGFLDGIEALTMALAAAGIDVGGSAAYLEAIETVLTDPSRAAFKKGSKRKRKHPTTHDNPKVETAPPPAKSWVAPKRKYQVVMVDTFSGDDCIPLTTKSKKKALAYAEEHGGTMNICYVYDDKGRQLYKAGTF